MRYHRRTLWCAYVVGILLPGVPCVAEERQRTAKDLYDAHEGSYQRLPVNPPHQLEGDPQFQDPQCYSVSKQGGNTVVKPKPVHFLPSPSNELRRVACECQLKVADRWQRYLCILGATIRQPEREKNAKWIAENVFKFFARHTRYLRGVF